MSVRSPEARKCAICGKPQDERFKPFCSRRCADLDLGRWLGGNYAIPAADTDDGDSTLDSGDGE